eukprot:TRINITY_DN2816_c0_g2_i2.p1 TRINITY_DN2816_c0_g2~~TRINITY_DN2816_c0_g2_i2.p1  ORF type:complete len:494 (-),score=126.22 TRINITY_DN2816_c0_g2_i2:1121-2602(-)
MIRWKILSVSSSHVTSPLPHPRICKRSFAIRNGTGNASRRRKSLPPPTNLEQQLKNVTRQSELVQDLRGLKGNNPDDRQRCLELFEQIQNSSFRTKENILNPLHAACIRCALIDEAQEIYEAIKIHGEPDVITFTAMANGLTKAGRIDEGVKVMNEMNAAGISPNIITINSRLQLLREMKDVDQARELFASLSNTHFEPNGYTYTTFIRIECESGDLPIAKDMVDQLHKSQSNFFPHASGALLDGYIHHKQIDKAIELFTTMRQSFNPNEENWGNLIGALAKADRFDDVQHYISEMINAGHNLNVIVTGAIMDGQVSNKRFQEAVDYFHQLKDNNMVSDVHYNLAFKALCYLDRPTDVEDFFRDMRRDPVHPPDGYTWSALLNYYKKHKQWKKIIDWYPTIRAEGYLTHFIRTTILLAFETSGQSEKMMDLITDWEIDGELPLSSIAIMMKHFLKVNDTEAAFQLFRSLKVPDHQPDGAFWMLLMDLHHRLGN